VLSTRAKLTVAFVAGLIAVTGTLFLAVLAARNNAVYHDIALYAAAQGDLAARVILDAAQSDSSVFATSDTALIAKLSPKVVDRLQAVPGYLVVIDSTGRAVYRSPDVMRLQGTDMASLQTQLASCQSRERRSSSRSIPSRNVSCPYRTRFRSVSAD
jgi:hypothetical protein